MQDLRLDLRCTRSHCGSTEQVGDAVCLIGRHLDVLRFTVLVSEHNFAVQCRDEREDLEWSVAREQNDMARILRFRRTIFGVHDDHLIW